MFVCECLAVSAWPSPSRIGGASLLSVTVHLHGIYMNYVDGEGLLPSGGHLIPRNEPPPSQKAAMAAHVCSAASHGSTLRASGSRSTRQRGSSAS